MTTPTMNLTAEPITAGGNVGNINSHNTIYLGDGIDASKLALAKWVSDLDFSRYQSQAFERYTEGTLLWALKAPELVAWLKNGGMLWCYGKPGAGKTVFASFVIDYLEKVREKDPKAVRAVCYIYCRYDTTRTTLQLFEAILKQLILRCPYAIFKRVQTAKEEERRLTLNDILSILQENFKEFPNIFVVLDAFDECFDEGTRHEVLHHLRKFKSVNILITSRPLPSIEIAMGSVARLIISARDVDVKTHFRFQKTINPALAKLVSRVLGTDVEAKLIEKADGRFLLAGLHIENLAAQTNTAGLLQALNNLPREVTATHEQTLERIRRQDPNKRRLAFHTLSWILYALRALTMTELRQALAIENLERMAEEDDLEDAELIISSCAGLVAVNAEGQVHFLHYTVQEYLQDVRTAPDFLTELDVATRCLKVVSFPGITSFPSNYSLFQYAASAWGPLVHRYEENETVLNLALNQLGDQATIEALCDTVRQIEYGQRFTDHDPRRCSATAVHLIAAYGLLRTCKMFFALHADTVPTLINIKDERGFTPLIWALRNGHLEVVKQLLAHPSIDLDSQDDSYSRTALSHASDRGHLEIVRQLLALPTVDVNSQRGTGSETFGDNSRRTPLSYAAEHGHSEVVKELLSHPQIDIDSKDDYGCSPISWAAKNGHSKVVKLLLACSNINCEDNNYHTPLSWAARNGQLGAVNELLAHPDIHLNSTDKKYSRTPLFWAARNRHFAIVKALLNHPNLDVNLKDRKSGQTFLSWAAGNNHLEIVNELLAHPNIDINSKDSRYGITALSWAAGDGHCKVVKMLVDSPNIDLNTRDTVSGLTPLLWAANKGHLEVVNVLLDTGRIELPGRRKISPATPPPYHHPQNSPFASPTPELCDGQDSDRRLTISLGRCAADTSPVSVCNHSERRGTHISSLVFRHGASILRYQDASFFPVTSLQRRSLRLLLWSD